MLVLALASWLLVGVAAAWLGKTLSSDRLGWLGFGLFGIGGAIAGGVAALGVADAASASVIGSAVGSLVGVFIRGAGEEIRSPGPGLAA